MHLLRKEGDVWRVLSASAPGDADFEREGRRGLLSFHEETVCLEVEGVETRGKVEDRSLIWEDSVWRPPLSVSGDQLPLFAEASLRPLSPFYLGQ